MNLPAIGTKVVVTYYQTKKNQWNDDRYAAIEGIVTSRNGRLELSGAVHLPSREVAGYQGRVTMSRGDILMVQEVAAAAPGVVEALAERVRLAGELGAAYKAAGEAARAQEAGRAAVAQQREKVEALAEALRLATEELEAARDHYGDLVASLEAAETRADGIAAQYKAAADRRDQMVAK